MPGSFFNTVTVTSDGLLATSRRSIMIASRGLLQPFSIPRYKQPSGGGTTGRAIGLAPHIYIGKSFEGIYRIHADDKEVLEIIIKAMTSGIIN